ncbi:MAG: 30S ribosomal protein S3 [candidate division Zixibacteria bacterium]|nr:30S ribosomal protein S3 [candidate division Zixibacteria bacterium]
MGQKTHPVGFRLGVNKSWNSKWFSVKSFANLVQEDILIKKYITARLDNAGLAKVEIIRAPKKVTIDIHTSRPGIVIGRRGAEVDKLREELQLLAKQDISLNIIEVKKPELSARLVADSIAKQLEGRVSFRRAMKRSLAATMKMGADGIKIVCKGRLNGAEIARSEKYMDGRVPLHTLRADIDYATATAHTTYGCIGVKIWICKGTILDRGDFTPDGKEDKMFTDRQESARGGRRGDKRRKRKPSGRVRRDNLSNKSRKGAPGGESSGAKSGAKKPESRK